jgi:pyruvate dehydrogenase phosphatase
MILTTVFLVLGVKQASGVWAASVLSTNHNGTEAAEVERIRIEHPGEDECVLRDRVLGSIAVTRGMFAAAISIC